ncbi:uncharacterized protein isoform X2 [Musca autumnalis]|uniref:uncharacterized protein isoform X2 n=1 Tax=Musca autumnalis TaxID=221902 RepID=UPI003CF3B42C
MAMLAEPRQRKRYNLVPKGKALYEDDSRFGTKMLEKMGWSKGKGLGAKEDGSQDFVRVRYKNDSQGLGFEMRDDQWTQHESSFNVLLKTLNGDALAENDSTEIGNKSSSEDDEVPRVGFGFQMDEKPKIKKSKLKEEISGISLEERSKQSKARVHYKKFTRGKDLSQYSEKDLANIFGKKAADDAQQAFFDQMNEQFNKTEQNENSVANKSETENFAGVQTISTGLSVSEYFKLKMASIKNKKENTTGDNVETGSPTTTEHDSAEKGKNENPGADLCLYKLPNGDNEEDHNLIVLSDQDTVKKEKKKKRKDKSLKDDGKVENKLILSGNEHSLKKEKKIKRQEHKSDDAKNDIVKDIDLVPATGQDSAKKEKKRRQEDMQLDEEKNNSSCTDNNHNGLEGITKKKKKKKDKHLENEENESTPTTETENDLATKDSVNITKKSSKKRKYDETAANPSEQVAEVSEPQKEIVMESKAKKSKTKKKGKEEETVGILSIAKKDGNQPCTSISTCHINLKTISQLSIPELQDKVKAFNICKISAFTAEKFRNVDLKYFPNSTGYGYNQNIELILEAKQNDELRINNLWSKTLCKYANLEKPTKTYKTYMKECFKARKNKQPKPQLKIKKWKRKDAFSLV